MNAPIAKKIRNRENFINIFFKSKKLNCIIPLISKLLVYYLFSALKIKSIFSNYVADKNINLFDFFSLNDK